MKKLLSIAISVLLLITAVTPAFAAPEVAYDGASVILSGEVDGAPEGAVVTVIVVKPDAKGNETDISAVLNAKDAEDYLELIEYIGAVKLNESGAFSNNLTINLKKTLNSGICGIYVNYLGQNELVKIGEFYHINADQLNSLVKEFNKDDADYALLLSESNLFVLSKVGADSEKYAAIEDKANFYNLLKGYAPFEDGKPNEDMSAALNYSVSFNEALALQEIKEADSVFDVLLEYNGKYWTLPLGEDDDINAVSDKETILSAIADGTYSDGSLLEKDFLERLGLSVFVNLVNQKSKVEDFIFEYGEVFGLDIDLYTADTITDYDRVDIQTYMLENKTDASTAVGIKELYDDAIDSLGGDDDDDDDDDDGKNKGNKVNIGGGGGGFSSKPPVIEVTEETQTQQVKVLPFNDVGVTHWAREYVSRLYNTGVVAGKDATTFSPDSSITKEEFVKLVVSALGLKIDVQSAEFADVSSSAWYAPYVAAAVNAGLISGKSDGTFGIGDQLSRQDAAVILSRAIGSQNDAGLDFADKDEVSGYATSAIASMTASGIITGYTDGTFKPNNSISRAESCAVLCRLLDKKGGAK